MILLFIYTLLYGFIQHIHDFTHTSNCIILYKIHITHIPTRVTPNISTVDSA